MIIEERAASIAEVHRVVAQTHRRFQNSLVNSVRRVSRVSDHPWKLGAIELSDLAFSPMIYEDHSHTNEEFRLIRHRETFGDAVSRYLPTPASECSQKIEAIRARLRSGHRFLPSLLEVESEFPMQIGLIDGLHRGFAMMLEGYEKMPIYYALPLPVLQPVISLETLAGTGEESAISFIG